MGYFCKRRAAVVVLLLLFTTGCFTYDSDFALSGGDCSTKRELGNHEVLSVSTVSGSIGFTCKVQFYTVDPHSTIVLSFDNNAGYGYNDGEDVYVAFYALDHNGSATLVDKYTYSNWSSIWTENVKQPNSARLLVVLNGDWMNNWLLHFQLKAEPGPISDYPFSLAAGVFALCLGCMTVLVLFVTCCWCCCCMKRESSEEISARRRRKMMDQLAKEGYSVTRDYGSVSSTTPLMRNNGIVVDIFGHPDPQLHPPQLHPPQLQPPQLQPPQGPRGASNYDPPPAYESVGTQRAPTPQQNAQVPVESTIPPHHVPEAVLVDIGPPSTAVLPTAPSTDDIHQDLMEFETPPELPASPIAAANNNHIGRSSNLGASIIPPTSAV